MYKVKLTNSHFKAQNDAEIRDITIGDLLKEISDIHPRIKDIIFLHKGEDKELDYDHNP